MEFIYLTFVLSLTMTLFNVEAQTLCQDLDSAACIAMAKQNTGLCADQVLARTACPAYCKMCPLTCYNCNITTSDVSQCNTIMCTNGEACLLKTNGVGSTVSYNMLCGPKTMCPIAGRKRNRNFSDSIEIQSRDTTNNVVCCDSDLCNSPAATKTSTSPTIGTTTFNFKSTTQTSSNISQTTNGCKRDIIIMLDKSIEMRPYFGEMKSFISDLISQLDIGTDKIRVALGVFGHEGHKRWDLDSFVDKASLLTAIKDLVVINSAYTGNNLAAIQTVLHNFYQGNRPSVLDDVILLSGGHAYHFFSHNKEDTAIQLLHQKSNNVISLAMGGANQNEMSHISSDNSRYFYVPTYNSFTLQRNIILSKLLGLICT